MPELPEAETVVRGLTRGIAGLVVDEVTLARADIVHGEAGPIDAFLRQRRIDAVTRRGKQVVITLAGGRSMIVHLGMTGRLTVCDRDEPLLPHTHMRVTFAGRRCELRFTDARRFGGIWLINGNGADGASWVGRRLPPVGDDPVGLTLGRLAELLCRRRQIKALLLDQQPIAGLGNIYCDEILHRAGIHPLVRASDLDRDAVRRLHRAMRSVLEAAIEAGGSSISNYRNANGEPGRFQSRHRAYGREGKPCKRCKTPIERILVAARSTFFCPRCQPPPAPRR